MSSLFEPSLYNWMLIMLSTFILGVSKAGLKGVEMINVTLMALVFGGKASTGVVLPLLCAADIMAVIYYHRHAQWQHFRKLAPWMATGILLGVFVGKNLDEFVFRKVMAVIILITVLLMLLLEVKRNIKIPAGKPFVAGMGLISGFTTMLGNLAGPFSNIYFLALRMPKNDFIGTAAWLFLCMNFFKLPFQAFYWHNINTGSLLTDVYLLPALALGFVAGIRIVRVIKNDAYRKMILLLTIAGAVVIFFKK